MKVAAILAIEGFFDCHCSLPSRFLGDLAAAGAVVIMHC